jgi:hypothetical protein
VTCFALREPIIAEALSHEEYLTLAYGLGCLVTCKKRKKKEKKRKEKNGKCKLCVHCAEV